MAELAAVVRLQRAWRRHLLSTRTRAFVKGSKEFEELDRNLHTAVEALGPLGQVWGSAVFKYVAMWIPSSAYTFVCTYECTYIYIHMYLRTYICTVKTF